MSLCQGCLSVHCPLQVAAFLAANPPKLSPGIREVVAALKATGKDVYLVSGGFRQMVYPVAALLDIPVERVFANRITFNEDSGDYVGHDASEFTCRAGGKAAAIRHIKANKGYVTMVMVGDGATDLEARQPGGADAFIGYGGVVCRESICEQSDWYLNSFDPLIETLSTFEQRK
jgi:phosphoserine phosphatase